MNHQSTFFFKRINLFLVLLCANIVWVQAQNYNPSVVQAIIQKKIAENPTDFQPIYILLEDQINCAAMEAQFQRNRTNIDLRATQTIHSLQEKAQNTQADILTYLRASSLVEKESIHPYWVANVIFAKAQPEVIAALSQLPEVAWIGHNGRMERTAVLDEMPAATVEPDSIEPGLIAVNAPALWAKGYTGYGTKVFIHDTGVYPYHPAIFSNYAGHYPDAAPDFFDYELGSTFPFDCSDHGTHVCGTTLGLDRVTKDTIGVAYNAQWIGSAVLCNELNEDVIGGLQWALDRDGNPATVDEMPDVINNSWWDPFLEDEDCQSVYVPLLDALQLAGIAVVFSAGNEGPNDSTITPPHNINIDTVNSFTVAAVATTSPFSAASFSSRGPSDCGGEGTLLIKPEVAAPGVNVRSCVLGNEYGSKSGTSMAAPHTCGVLLLLKEAFPYLTGRELLLSLYHSCTDLGIEGEDNTYGMGLINAEAAYQYLISKGHEPVLPISTTDVILVNSFLNSIECENELNTSLVFENASSDTLKTLDIHYSTELSTALVYNWTGNLAPNEQISLQLPALEVPTGEQMLVISLQKPNETEDLRGLNNQMIHHVKVLERANVSAYSTDAEFCQGSNAVLQSDFEGVGQVEWYNDLWAGDLLGTGNAFETEALDTTTTFYADVLHTEKTGFADYDASTSTLDVELKAAMVFDAKSDFNLKSVTVYLDIGGGREITLYDNRGEKVKSKFLFLTEGGTLKVDLNFPVLQGDNYFLTQTTGRAFYYSETGTDFPYTIPDILTIHGGTVDTTTITDTNYFFYDWEVEHYDVCGRTPVTVAVSPTDSLPIAEFALTMDTFYLDSPQLTGFTNTSQNSTAWLWDFGDGTTSNEENPTHTYTQEGTYYASLTSWNAAGCADATTLPITIFETIVSTKPSPEIEAVSVYPNPVKETLFIDLEEQQTMFSKLYLYNTAGVVVQTKNIDRQMVIQELELQNVPAGLYYLVLQGAQGQVVKKVVKE